MSPNSKYRTFLLGAAATAVTMAASPAAFAQQQTNPVDYCRENAADKDARIACLEAAITGLMSRNAAPDADAMAAAAAPTQQSAQAAGDAASDETAPDEAPAVAVAEAPAAAPEPEKPTGLGAEQVLARQNSDSDESDDEDNRKDAITIAIADFAKTNTGKLIIVLNNGQVWRQIEGDNQNLRLSRDDKLTAEVWSSRFGGYKLRITEAKRTIRVQRLQ